MKVVLATGNAGKVREFTSLLADQGIEIVAQNELGVVAPEETGLTFIENALLKARAASEQTGLPAIADDSGIAIDALKGEPGIYSARFAGVDASDQDNIDLVLERLKGVDPGQRDAQFHCVLVYLSHAKDPTPIICHGVWAGTITETQQGSEGFGYDPIFWLSDRQCTAAELTTTEKNAVSHRGQATRELVEKLVERRAVLPRT